MDAALLVPGALGIALSPVSVASIVFLLGHRRGYASPSACAAGWVLAIAAGLVVAVVVGERLPAESGDGPPVRELVAVVAGMVLLGLAAWQWTVRRLPDGSPSSSRWSDAMEALGPLRAFGLGVLGFVSNAKALVLVLAAGLSFGDADPGPVDAVTAGVVFVLVAGSTALLPIVLAVVLGSHTRRALAAMRVWIARWGSLVLVAVLVVVGLVQLVTGIVGLLD